ncbi:hypothetical protein ACFW2Y_30980 [Streptomyces sp. NPDC058877]|uniref:hypothetical protein n=1 Tax=unclassified Streptomyces TaxID=2593676 RepID=UPI0036B63345
MTSSREAVQLYEITHPGTGPEPEVRTVEVGEVAAVIEYTSEHGMQVLVRPRRGPVGEPSAGKGDAS